MPKRKKPVSEMTSEELARRVFPKNLLAKLKAFAHRDDAKSDAADSPSHTQSNR